ncbi:MAG: discoidin domain-containing protein [Kiritimatiellae bacterium]|nr:discoidin domain-containing protein [Kiritimatiellia bacterium]
MTAGAPTACAGEPRARWEGWHLIAALAAALAVRLLYSALAYASTFDSAVVGCMAIRILRDGERPLFFYGQHYFGSLEAWLAAVIFALAGVGEVTLTLAAILPSLGWIAATWWALRLWAGPRAAAAAIWPLALPGWVVLHYSVGTYGGYPIAFALGTLGLALALHAAERDLDGRRLLPCAFALGAIAGLAAWTHFISAAWLLPAAVVLAISGARRRFRWSWLWPWLAATPLALATAAPLFLGTDIAKLTDVAGWRPSPGRILQNVAGLFGRPLRDHLFFPHAPFGLRLGAGLMLAATVTAAALTIATEPDPRQRRRLVSPAVALGLFLVMYLPHTLAALRVPRYVIPLWTIALGWGVALPCAASRRSQRIAGVALAALWAAYHTLGFILELPLASAKRRDHIAERNAVVAAARAAGLRSATVLGSPIVGHRGEIFTFAAQCEIAFVNPWDERHRRSAEFAEADDASGYLVEQTHAERVRAALRDLGASWSEIPAHRQVLFHRIHATPAAGRAVPASSITVRGPDGVATDALTDGQLGTSLRENSAAAASLEIELTEPRPVEALHLVGTDPHGIDLPRDFTVEISTNGSDWVMVRQPAIRVVPAWTSGPRVFLLGYRGHLECRWPAVVTRRLRLTILPTPSSSRTPWSLSELRLREAPTSPNAIRWPDPSAVIAACRTIRPPPEFLAADRWLSAKLADAPGAPRVYPRPNPRYRPAGFDRYLDLRRPCAVAVAAPWADETRHLLEAEGLEISAERDAGGYAIFGLRARPTSPSSKTLFWQGTFLLRAAPAATAATAR